MKFRKINIKKIKEGNHAVAAILLLSIYIRIVNKFYNPF